MNVKSGGVMIAQEIQQRFISLHNENEAQHLARFFKTGPGQYGQGDKFLGIKVPVTRGIVKEYWRLVEVDDCLSLVKSEWHEIRLAGFLLLIELYQHAKKCNGERARMVVNAYVEHIPYGNNWDLVDLVAPKILGDWLVSHPQERTILDKMAMKDNSLWHQRVAMVATLALICASSYEDTLRIAKQFLTHKHDLIHKATGWMLREMGKRGGYDELIQFLDENARVMPRTALRYAIERLPEDLRRFYMNK